jgi:hypothetical protein
MTGELLAVDVTIVMIKHMAMRAKEKKCKYKTSCDLMGRAGPLHLDLTRARLVAPPAGCCFVPIVFSVFGDLLDDSFDLLLDLVSDQRHLACFFKESLVAVAASAKEVHVVSSAKQYGRAAPAPSG